jgi:hypothetical protein
MEYIEKISGIWRSKIIQREPRKCHVNLQNRLTLISKSDDFNECIKEWKYISYDMKGDELVPCICGMPIKHFYYIKNESTGQNAQLGSECINRINENSIKNYNESKLKKGLCYCCEKAGLLIYSNNLEKHYKSKVHIKKSIISNNNLNICIENKSLLYKQKEQKIKERLEKLKTHKECTEVDCNELIPNTMPEWNIRCIKCWKTWKNI